jgi:glycosyltransferase involved in cell wall biosynthesis
VPSVVVAHSCVNSWASACSEEKSFAGEAWRVYSANVRAGLHGADAWVAPTLAFRDRVARQYKPPTAGSAIWNGVDEGDWGTPPKQPTILAAGRLWDKAKNLPALSSLGSEIEWPIRIAGPLGPDSSKAGASSDGCAFLGEIPHHDLLREMAAASVYVSPALYEPFGLAVLEAAHAGCALLLSDIPSFRELWDGAAVFFDPHDRQALRRCLRSLCDDELRRRSLQRAATVRARRYLLRNTVDRYRSLYESLLPTHPRVVEPVNRAEILA